MKYKQAAKIKPGLKNLKKNRKKLIILKMHANNIAFA